MASRAPASSASASCAKTPVSGSTMPIFTDSASRARIGSGATTALAAHARPALRTARRPIRRACGDAAFRVFGFKLAAPNQPGQTLVALAYVGKARDGVVPLVNATTGEINRGLRPSRRYAVWAGRRAGAAGQPAGQRSWRGARILKPRRRGPVRRCFRGTKPTRAKQGLWDVCL